MGYAPITKHLANLRNPSKLFALAVLLTLIWWQPQDVHNLMTWKPWAISAQIALVCSRRFLNMALLSIISIELLVWQLVVCAGGLRSDYSPGDPQHEARRRMADVTLWPKRGWTETFISLSSICRIICRVGACRLWIALTFIFCYFILMLRVGVPSGPFFLKNASL